MNKFLSSCSLSICLFSAALGRASFSQDGIAKTNDVTKDQAAYQEMIKRAMEAARKRAAYEAMVRKSIDEAIPVVEEANFSIDIASKEMRLAGGKPIEVDITLKNNGGSNLRLTCFPVETFYDIQVTTKLGLVDSFPSRLMRRYAGSVSSYSLSKGRDLSASVTVSNLFDMSLAGSYQVKVSKRFRLRGAKDPVTISSNVLNIEVTSDAPLSQWHQ